MFMLGFLLVCLWGDIRTRDPLPPAMIYAEAEYKCILTKAHWVENVGKKGCAVDVYCLYAYDGSWCYVDEFTYDTIEINHAYYVTATLSDWKWDGD